jgi:hypothetical protein
VKQQCKAQVNYELMKNCDNLSLVAHSHLLTCRRNKQQCKAQVNYEFMKNCDNLSLVAHSHFLTCSRKIGLNAHCYALLVVMIYLCSTGLSRNDHTKSISTGAQYVTPNNKIYCEKVEMSWYSSGNWFFVPNSWLLQWLVNGTTQLCTSEKECNKLNLNVA